MAIILVIDDQESVRRTVTRILISAGHEVIEAEDGKAGIALWQKHGPALVVTDIFMPNKEGIETIRELRKSRASAKILAISGGPYLAIAQELGADAVLKKPFRAEALLATIATLIG